MQLEAQVEESRATFTKHKCEKVAAVIEGQVNLPQALETRTLTLEHKMSLLDAKFESLNMLISQNQSMSAIHHNISPIVFVCDTCDEQFETKNNLKAHKDATHYTDKTAQEKSEDEAQEVFFCTKCDFSTQYEEYLSDHIQYTHHNTR